MLLKSTFKNCWLQSIDKNMEPFIMPREASNDLGLYEGEDDSDIAELIFNDESLDSEFKASIILDWVNYIKQGILPKSGQTSKEMERCYFLKPVTSMLNSKNGGKIIIGIREKHKVDEEIKKTTFSSKDLQKVKLQSFSRTNGHYLTGIDLDLEILKKDNDQMSQIIDNYIKKYIYPDPFLNNDPIKVDFKKFLGKTICIIHVNPGNKEYYLKEGENFNLYIRHNSSDKNIKTAKEAIDFYKSKQKN